MIKTANRIDQVEEYYFSKKMAEVRQLDSPEVPVINLGIGSPDGAPPSSAVDQLVESARNPGNHGYQPYKGIPALRQAIASLYYKVYDVTLDPESMILPLMGSKEGILHISMAFVNEGDEVLVPDPGYPTYSGATRLAGGIVRNYAMEESMGWRIDVDELANQDLSRVKIMWVNFPHMPTGKAASSKDFEDLISLARKNNFLLVNDNPYSMILNGNPISILANDGAADVALELNSLSKSHNMAGWRIGWVAGRREFIEATLKVRTNMDSGMFLGLQHAAVEALKCGDEWFEKLNGEYQVRGRIARQILDRLGCTYEQEQSGLFVWAKAPDRIPDVEKWMDELLHEAKVFITPGFVFGERGRRHIRISLCQPEEKMREALSRVEKVNGALKRKVSV